MNSDLFKKTKVNNYSYTYQINGSDEIYTLEKVDLSFWDLGVVASFKIKTDDKYGDPILYQLDMYQNSDFDTAQTFVEKWLENKALTGDDYFIYNGWGHDLTRREGR